MSRITAHALFTASGLSTAPSLRPWIPRTSFLHSRTIATSASSSDPIQPIRQVFQDKYAAKLNAKLREKGLKDIDDLKSLAESELEHERKRQRQLYDNLLKKSEETDTSSRKKRTSMLRPVNFKEKKYRSPIKPLDSIIDLSKAVKESPDVVKKLWTAYHLAPASPPRLGATIPTEIYKSMINVAKRYPSFVIPIPASLSQSSLPPSADVPMEMHFLQWAFIKPAPEDQIPEHFKSIPTPPPNLPPTTILFTPLAEYQMRQEFAQPSLIITHYTELALSHGIVLMRGDLTPSTNGIGTGRLGASEAQLLALRMQQLFHWTESSELSQKALQEARQELLRCFHEKPHEFNVAKLLQVMQDL